jgi:hypothetical protein
VTREVIGTENLQYGKRRLYMECGHNKVIDIDVSPDGLFGNTTDCERCSEIAKEMEDWEDEGHNE